MLRVLLGQLGRLDKWGRWKVAYSSELLGLEARRVIDRLRLELALDDQGVSEAQQTLLVIEQGIGSILLTQTVLYRASLPMPTVLKTLDAIHLTSALLFQEQRKENPDQRLERLAVLLLNLFPMSVNEILPSGWKRSRPSSSIPRRARSIGMSSV